MKKVNNQRGYVATLVTITGQRKCEFVKNAYGWYALNAKRTHQAESALDKKYYADISRLYRERAESLAKACLAGKALGIIRHK